MSLLDIFSPSFLLYLGMMVLAVAGLIVYFESKMREQNHKIASMFSIVSTLAEDMNQMKFVISHVTNQGGAGPILEENRGPFSMPPEQENLIEVSDDEEDEEDIDEDEEDEDDEDEEELEHDEDESDSDEELDYDDESLSDNNVKVLKISNEDDLVNEQDSLILDELDDESSSSEELGEEQELVLMDEPVLEEPIALVKEVEVKNEKKEPEKMVKNKTEDLKTISIDLEEHESGPVDYKKMPLQKLKSIVVEKGLISDASKLKKHELLKLLGIE
jgi:hypothetical protein